MATPPASRRARGYGAEPRIVVRADGSSILGKGTSGIQDGHAHVEMFLAWKNQVEDFKPYLRNGDLNLSLVASECGIQRGVLYTNTAIAEIHLPALKRKLLEDGVLKPAVADPVEVVRLEPRRDAVREARFKQLQEENELLKTENRELRKRLERFDGMEEVLRTTGRLPW